MVEAYFQGVSLPSLPLMAVDFHWFLQTKCWCSPWRTGERGVCVYLLMLQGVSTSAFMQQVFRIFSPRYQCFSSIGELGNPIRCRFGNGCILLAQAPPPEKCNQNFPWYSLCSTGEIFEGKSCRRVMHFLCLHSLGLYSLTLIHIEL